MYDETKENQKQKESNEAIAEHRKTTENKNTKTHIGREGNDKMNRRMTNTNI